MPGARATEGTPRWWLTTLSDIGAASVLGTAPELKWSRERRVSALGAPAHAQASGAAASTGAPGAPGTVPAPVTRVCSSRHGPVTQRRSPLGPREARVRPHAQGPGRRSRGCVRGRLVGRWAPVLCPREGRSSGAARPLQSPRSGPLTEGRPASARRRRGSGRDPARASPSPCVRGRVGVLGAPVAFPRGFAWGPVELGPVTVSPSSASGSRCSCRLARFSSISPFAYYPLASENWPGVPFARCPGFSALQVPFPV